MSFGAHADTIRFDRTWTLRFCVLFSSHFMLVMYIALHFEFPE